MRPYSSHHGHDRSWGQILLSIPAAAVVTLFCLNIFNPLPALFAIIIEVARPLGLMMPLGWEFVPILTVLAGLNVLLAMGIRRWASARYPSFADWFFRLSITFLLLGVGYITMVMYALSRMDG